MKYIRFIIIIFVILALQACLWHGKQAHEVDNHKEEVSQETSIDTLSLPIDVRVKFVTLQDGLPSNAVSDIYQDQKGFMWFSTNNGLARYDGNQMKVYLQDSAYASSSDRRVKRITEDKDFKYMWIYTASETFYCLDMTTGHLVDYLSEAKGWRAQERPLHFTQSKLQENGLFYMWGPKDGGLIVDYRDGNFKVKHLSAKEMEAILPKLQDVKMADKQLVQKWKVPNGRVLTDNKGGKWIYNNTGILRKVVGDSLITLRLLPNETNYIDYERFNIVEDNHGLVWISTYGKGLFVFNHDLNQGQHFVANEKGESPIASNYLLCITADRRDGVWVSAEYGGVSHLQVMDKERSPKINFSTLDYSDVNNVKYTYWLEGYDSSWSVPSPTPWVNYQNLPFGSYRLHVKASYSDGIWGKESVLDISVEPPFYLSVWAWVFYALFLTVVIVMLVKSIREKNILKGKIKFEQEFTRYKLVFFTNIAHEFRTPLTLIQGSLEKEKRIMKTNHWQLELEKTVRTMDKSVQRMLRLIDQLLEFRKMQAGKLKLSLQETDVVMFVQGICKMFDDAAESKQIDFKFESQLPAYLMYLDQQKMDKVVFNLLSNAFKYTPAKGTISVSLSFTDVMTIRVADTGVGIPQEKREQLFSRFMQSSYTGESFGIGLHLTHELVRTHHGEITYQENEGGGSVFVVTIPLQKDCYEASDFLVKDSPILKADLTKERDGQEEKTTDAVPSAPSAPLNRRTILLIEDDNDVREFLLSELESCFDLKVASDGKAGIAMAKELDVDLIVSDVMMPGMNGFELTKRLKNSFETSHIPIILLTALSTDENVLEGTESGADAYITKPFSPQLLMARILQLLNQREILRQKFGKVPQEIRSAMLRNEQDSLFVKRLDSIVYSRLGEQDLSVDKVAGLLHLGRTIFYKKVRGTMGYTPNEYIRVIRLRKAAELLKEGEKNVSEVAYAVGFDNPYYFSKCFKEQFGMPPSQYRS